MNCNETIYDVITSIEAYPFTGVSTTRGMSVHGKHVEESGLGLDTSAKLDVPMKPKSCTPSEKHKLEIPGESYEVTVSWQTHQLDKDAYTVLEELNEYPKHLILRTYSGNGYFIQCEEHGYSFSYTEKEGMMECELGIHNRNGIQRIL